MFTNVSKFFELGLWGASKLFNKLYVDAPITVNKTATCFSSIGYLVGFEELFYSLDVAFFLAFHKLSNLAYGCHVQRSSSSSVYFFVNEIPTSSPAIVIYFNTKISTPYVWTWGLFIQLAMKMEPDIIINRQQIADSFNNIFTNIASVY